MTGSIEESAEVGERTKLHCSFHPKPSVRKSLPRPDISRWTFKVTAFFCAKRSCILLTRLRTHGMFLFNYTVRMLKRAQRGPKNSGA